MSGRATTDELKDSLRFVDALQKNRLRIYRPLSKKVREFHRLGASYRERILLAANQSGKSYAGAHELAMHLTGEYPDWWEGRRFSTPVRAWAASKTNETTRDTPQRLLLGADGQYGTGAIPKAAIVKTTPSKGISGAVDTVTVRHKSGGISSLRFKSYDQGREKWQSDTLHCIWFDEEPDAEIYTEGVTRTNALGGMTFITVTPLLGMTQVVSWFYPHPSSPDRAMVNMTIEESGLYSEKQIEKIVRAYPAHEREARAKGIPMLGSGRVFPIAERDIMVEPFPIPDYWPVIGGLDFGGWDHPTAACLLAIDQDSDTIFVTREYREREVTYAHVASVLRRWGDWIPWAWPRDGNQHDRTAGKPFAQVFRENGLRMIRDQASYPDGGYSLEGSVGEMLDRMQTGRWKVFQTCRLWFEEFRLYHRERGKIVKLNDDLISASRIAMMMRRYAKRRASVGQRPRVVGVDFDPLAVSHSPEGR